MAELFPAELEGVFDSQSFRKVLGDNILKSKFLTGPPQTRRRSTKRIDNYTGNFRMSRDQLDVFELWYSSTMRDGSLSFILNDPIKLTPKNFKFSGPPAISHIGGIWWSVSVAIEDA